MENVSETEDVRKGDWTVFKVFLPVELNLNSSYLEV